MSKSRPKEAKARASRNYHATASRRQASQMWRPRLAGRFEADIILFDLLVDLVSCDRRRDFTRPRRARFTDLAAQSRVCRV